MFESPVANHVLVDQGSDEWLAIRLPLATASEFKNILAKNKGKTEAAARRNYRVELALQTITKRSAERYKSKQMEWGNETEELARTEYMLRTGNVAETCGIFVHKTKLIGDSPDGLIGTDGCLEIKCYELANHLEALKTGKMPAEHYPQVQGHMWMTGRKYCDFESFAPEFPEESQIFIQRIWRDDEYIATLEAEIDQFMSEVDEEVKFISSYKPPVLELEQPSLIAV